MFNKILLATDGSDHALRAAAATAEIATKFGASVTMIYVFTAPVAVAAYAGAGGPSVDTTMTTQYAQEIQDCVAMRTGHLLETAGLQYDTIQETGHPAEVICRIANSGDFDLIVLGSRGHSPLHSLVLGSTSDRVVHHAHCPVLVVK